MARRSVWGTVALLLALLFVTTHGLRGSASQVEGHEARTTLRSRGGSRFNPKAIEGLEVTSSPFSSSTSASLRSRSNRRGGSRAEDAAKAERVVATTTPKSRRDHDRDIKLSAAARKPNASATQPSDRRRGSAFAVRKSTTQIPQRESPSIPVTEPTKEVKSNDHRTGSTSPKETDEPRRIGLFRTRNGAGRKNPSTTTTEEPEIGTTEEFNSNKQLDVTGPSVFSGTTEIPRSRTGRKIQTTLSSRDLKRGLPSSGRYTSRKNAERNGGQTAERRSDDSSAKRRHDIVPSGSESVSVDVTVPGDLRSRSRIDNSLPTSSSRVSESTTEFSSQRKASTEGDRRNRGRGRFNDEKNSEAPSTSRSTSRRGSSRLSDASPVDNSLDRNSRSRNEASRLRNVESRTKNSDGNEGNGRGRGRGQTSRSSNISSRSSSAERNSGRSKNAERRGRPSENKVTETKISTSEGRGRSRVKSRAIGTNVVPPTTTSPSAETTISTSRAATASTEIPTTSTTTLKAEDRIDTTTERRGNRGRVTTLPSADKRAFKEDFFNHGLGFRGRKIATEAPSASTEAQNVAQRNPNTESPPRGNPGWTLKRRPSFHPEETVTESSGAAVISNEIPTNQASQATTPSVAKAGRGNKNFKKTSAQSKVNVDFEESDNYPKEFKAKIALLKSGQESTSRPGFGAISEKNPSRHTRSTSVPSESEAPNEDHVTTASESSVATVVSIIPESATSPSAPSVTDAPNGLSKKRPTTDPQFVARSKQKLESARKLVHRPEAINNVGSEEEKRPATTSTTTNAPTTRKSGEPVAKRPSAKVDLTPKKPEERKASTFAKRFSTTRPENSPRVSVPRKAEKIPRNPKARKMEDSETTTILNDLEENVLTESSTLPSTTEEFSSTTAQITPPPKIQILSRRAKEIPRQGISTTTRRSRAWISQHVDKNFQEPVARKSSESSTRRSTGSSTTTRKTRAWNVAYIDKNWHEPDPKYTTESSRSTTTTTKRSRIWSAFHLDKNGQEPTVKSVTHGLPTIEGHSTVSRGRSKPQESTSSSTEKISDSGNRYTRKKTEVFKPFEATPKSSTTEETAQSARRREFRPRTATYRRHSEPPSVMVVNAVPAEKSPSTGNSIAITPKAPVKFHATVRGTDVNSSQRSARQEPTVNVRISGADGNGNATDRASGIVGTSNGASGNADSNIFSPTRSTLLLNSNATLLEQLRSTVAPLLNALGNRTPIFSAAVNDNVGNSSSGARVTPSGAPPRFSARYKGAELFVRRPNVLEPAGPFLTSSTTPFTPTEDTGSAPPITIDSPGEPKVLTFYQALETASITNELGQTDLQQRQIGSSAQVDARNATDSDSNGTTNANNDTNTTTTTAAMPPVSINEATVASITMDSSVTTIENTPSDPTTQENATPSEVTILPETTDMTATVGDNSAGNETSSTQSAATLDLTSVTMTPEGDPTPLETTTTMSDSLEAISTVPSSTEMSTAAAATVISTEAATEMATEAATEASTEATTTQEVAMSDDGPQVTTEASLVGRIVYLETDENSTSTTAANDSTSDSANTAVSQESSMVTDGSLTTDVTSEMIATVQSTSEVPMTTTVQTETTTQSMSATETTTSSGNSNLEIIFETATPAPETTTAEMTDLPEATTTSTNAGLEIVVETATSIPETTSVLSQTMSTDASTTSRDNSTLEVVVETATQVPETTGAAQVTPAPESTSIETMNGGNGTLEMVIELTTSNPETTVQATSAPETTVQATTAPATTTVQATSAPELTTVQATTAPETTTVQATSVPETTVQATSAPETTVQATSAPETTTVQATSAPETTVQATSAPETTVQATSAPETTVQATSAPETTTVQATSAPETTVQATSAPETTAQTTSAPETMIPETTTDAAANSTPEIVDTATSAPETTTATQTTSPPETTTTSVDPTSEMAIETATPVGETTAAALTTETSNLGDSMTTISSTTVENPTSATISETSTESVETRLQDSTMAQVTEENLQMTTPSSTTPDSGVTETPAVSTTPESISSSTQTMLEMIRARLGNETDMPGLQGDSLMSRMMKRLMMTLFSDSSEEISSENVIETTAQPIDQSNATESTTSSGGDEVPSLLGGFLDNTDGNQTGNLDSSPENGTSVTESIETTPETTTILSQSPQSEVTTQSTTPTTPTANPNPTEATTTLIPTTIPQMEDQQRTQTPSNPSEDVASSTLPTDVTNVTTNELTETTTLTATTTTTTLENSTMDLSQTNRSNGDLAINNVTGDDGVTNTVPETTTTTATTITTTATIDTTTVPSPTNDDPNSLAGLQDTTTATAQRTASDDPQATSQPDQTATSGSTTSVPDTSSETVTTATSDPTTVPIATTDAPTNLPTTTAITESSTTDPSTTAQSSASSSTSSEVSSTSAAPSSSSEMPTTAALPSSDVPTTAEPATNSEMSTSSEMTTSEMSATMESTMAAAQLDNSTSTEAPSIVTTMAASNTSSEAAMSTEATTTMMMMANDTNMDMSTTTSAPIMTTTSTTTPGPMTTQYLGRFGGSRITPAPRFSVSSSTKTPLRDYLVYGIFPNKTIVRKRPEDNLIDARNVDSPYVIFGIFPDGKLVRKFPNGTVIPDPPTNPVEVVFSLSTTTSTTNRPRPVFIDNQPANRGYYYNQNAALYNNRPGDAGSTPGGLPGQVNLGLSGNAIGPNGEAPASQPVATKMSDFVTRMGSSGTATTSAPTIVTPSNVNTQGGRFIQDRERDEASRSREAGGQRSTVYIGQEKFINYWTNGNPADTNNSRLVSVKINSVASSVNEGPASSSGSQQTSFDILPNSQTGGGGQVTAPPGFPWKDPLDQIFGITTQSAIITASVASNTLDDTSPSRSPIMSPPINPLAEVFSPSVATLGPTTSDSSTTTTTLAPTTSATTTTTTAAPTTTTAAPTTTTTTAAPTTTTTTAAPTTTTTTTTTTAAPTTTTTTTTTTAAPTTITTTTTTTPAPTTTTTAATTTSTTAAATPTTTAAPTTLDGQRQTAFGTTFDDLAFLNSLLQKPSTGGSGGATPKTLTEVEQLLANKILSLALADPGPTRSPKAIQSSNVSPNSVFSDLSPGPSSRPIIIDLLQTTSTAKPIPTQAPTVSIVTPTVTTPKPTPAPIRTTVPPQTTRKPQSQVVITARPVAPRRPTTTQAPQGFGAGLLQALFGGNFFGTPSTTQRPVQATWRPVPTNKPIQTTAKPVKTTARPVQTTLAPIRTTSIQSPAIKEVHVTPRNVETSKVQSNTPNSLDSGGKPLAITTTTIRTSTYSNEDDAKFLAALLKATGQGGVKIGGGLNTQDEAKFLADLLKVAGQGGGAKRGSVTTTTTAPSTQGLSIDDEAFLRTILNGQASVQPAAANSQAISDAALLAALLKAQGIEPSTPANRLREQLQSANGNGLQAARPTTTTRPRPIPVTTKKIVTPPPRAQQPIWSPSSTYPPPLFSNFANFGSAPERPRGESGAEASVGDGSVRSQVFNAAIGATRAFSQFLGAAITGAAQQLQSFVRNGTRYVTEVVG